MSSSSGSEKQHPMNQVLNDLYLQSVIIQMSFFEKMMRINQAQQHQDKRADEQQQHICLQSSRSYRPEDSLRNSSKSINDEMPEVPQQPKPQTVYVSVKPLLLTTLLPKREQLLREMLAKKREFELKKMTNSNMRKHSELKQRLEESSLKFQHSSHSNRQPEQSHVLVHNSNSSSKPQLQSNPNNAPHIGYKVVQQKKSLKESLVLDISESSNQKGICRSQVGENHGDALNREIMMRLLNMLENERNDRKDFMAMSMSNHFAHIPLPHEKQAPIIINNILKTPVDALNKDLIQRQMKIKMLENNRSKQKSFFNFGLNPPFTEQKSDRPLTQRSEAPKCNQFNGTVVKTGQQHSKGKISLECSRISVLSKKANLQEPACKQEQQQTKPNSNFSSQMTEKEAASKFKKPRQREFNKPKAANAQKKQEASTAENKQKEQCSNRNCTISDRFVHKASVRLDIPLNQSSDTEGLTLAEAFKKRVGKLKSQRQKPNKQSSLSKKRQDIVIGDQNFVKTQLYPQYTTPKDTYMPLFPMESNQTINLTKEPTKAKRQRNIATSVAKQKENTNTKNSREPSKQLIDRLIGGERAKVSKKQMYALTRKNYQNLPEIQAKKKEEEKKKHQLERLAKIRELQRSTRSLKQVKMTLE